MNDKTLTTNGITLKHVGAVLAAIGMLCASIYLMAHHFQTYFPIGIQEGTICTSHGFWSCDAAAYSPVSVIFGIPLALPGILAGLFLIFSSIFPSKTLERTNRTLTCLNALGCITLFFYSLIFLNHLCPGCTVYYIFSITAALFYFFNVDKFEFNFKIIGIYAVIAAVATGIYFFAGHSREQAQLGYRDAMVNQFKTYINYGDNMPESPLKIYQSTEKFNDAPLRITIFSDFQCPFCNVLAKSLPRVALRYQGKINIQYFHYPLDAACNPSMPQTMHPMACKGAYLSMCKPEKFAEIHDLMFAKNRYINDEWLAEVAEKYGVQDCYTSDKAKALVSESIEQSKQFGIVATPSMIINGRKIEGAMTSTQISMILDYLLEQYEKGNNAN